MLFYEIDIQSQPKIVFACTTNNNMTEYSQNIIDHREGMLELSIPENVEMAAHCDFGTAQESIFMEKGNVMLVMPDGHYTVRPAVTSPHVQITSIAVKIDHMHFVRHSWHRESAADEDTERMRELLAGENLLLPCVYRSEPEEAQLILSLMKALISRFPDKSAAGRCTCLSRWYEICAMIDTGFRTMLSQELSVPERETGAYGPRYYVYKIKKYIRAHLHETIHMGDLAALLNLSPDYVGKLFREDVGYSVNDYIARQRVQELCEIIGGSPEEQLSVLALRCGFHDIRYAQRLFRKYTGVTMSVYRKLGQGVTLYHENPWIKERLEKDIFAGTWENEE